MLHFRELESSAGLRTGIAYEAAMSEEAMRFKVTCTEGMVVRCCGHKREGGCAYPGRSSPARSYYHRDDFQQLK